MNFKHFFREISVEPALFLFYCTYNVITFLNENLYIQKACRVDHTLEPDLNTNCDDKEKGIVFASKVQSTYGTISSIFCLIYLILAVCWSDKAGKRRRPLIFLPIFGHFLQSCSGFIHSFYWYWSPTSAAISDSICQMIGGGYEMMRAAAFMYIFDISNLESRTMRIGILSFVIMISMPLSKGGSGYLLRSVGFYYSYMLCVVLSVLEFAFGLIFIKSSPVEEVKAVSLRQIFNITPVVDSFRIVFNKKLARKRTIVLLLLFLQLFSFFSIRGEFSVIYLFFKYKFNWDEKMFSSYMAYKHIVSGLGSLFCSVVLCKLMKVHDGVIGVISSFFDIIASIGYTIAFESWQIYVVSLFDVFHGAAVSVCSSFLSKFYDNNEFGRLFAVIYVFLLFIPLSYSAYNIVFQNTLESFPSAFFIISIVLNVGVLFLYWFSWSLHEKISRENPPKMEGEAIVPLNPSADRVGNHKDEISVSN